MKIWFLISIFAPSIGFAWCRESYSYLTKNKKVIYQSSIAGPSDESIPQPDIEMPGADPSSLRPVFEEKKELHECGSAYAKDNKNVYYRGRTTKADTQSFKVSRRKNLEYGEDKYSIFVEGKAFNKKGFDTIESDNGTNYFKNADGVFKVSGQKIDNADPKTFSVLLDRLAKDKSKIYLNEVPLLEVDAATFQRTSEPGSSEETSAPYYQDKKGLIFLYWNCEKQPCEYSFFRIKKNQSINFNEPPDPSLFIRPAVH